MSDPNADLLLALQTGSMFGPNPYSQFPNGIQSTSYSGAPTDALGRPIQAQPGTTLNSTPQAPAPAPKPTAPNVPQYIQTQGGSISGGAASTNAGMQGGQWVPGQMVPNPAYSAQAPSQSAPAPSSSQGGSPSTSYQNALQLLSNPGHVTTPGATVPESQPVTGQPSVLDQFLASQKGGQGAGNYSNQGFFNTLNRLRGNNAPAAPDANVANTSLNPGVGMANQLSGNASSQGGGNQMGGGFSFPAPPAGTPGAPMDASVQGYLDANGRPTAALGALAQQWGAAQQQVASGKKA